MSIEEAKKNLESQIIQWDGVNGIGVVSENGEAVIEITIDKNNSGVQNKLNTLVHNNQWHGHSVKIVPANEFNFQ